MPLIFAGKSIPGINGPPNRMPPQYEGVLTKFFGVAGEFEIKGAIGGRQIEYYVVLFDAGTLRDVASVEKLLQSYEQLVGTNGTLQETGNNPRSFNDCTFRGFVCQGRAGGSILRDYGQTLGGGFWTDGTMSFYQNKVT